MFNLFSIIKYFESFCFWDIGSAISIGSGIMGLAGGGSDSGPGNVAGGMIYDSYASHRGKAADTLDALIYGGNASGGGTPLSYDEWAKQQGGAGGGGSNTIYPGYAQNYDRSLLDNMQGLTGGSADWVRAVTGTGGGADTSQAAYQKYLDSMKGGGGSSTDMIKAMPGYQFGMNQGADALNRTMNQTGNQNSGAQQIGLSQFGQQYAGSFYDKMVAQLSNMAGVGQGGTNLTQAQDNLANQQNQNWAALQQGVGGLQKSGVLNGIFGGGGGLPSLGGSNDGVYTSGGFADMFGGA